jgi:hypothetical protein
MEPKFHYCVHKDLKLPYHDSVVFSLHSHTEFISKCILILPLKLHLGLPCGIFPSGFHTKILYEFLICFLRGTCLAHLIILDCMTLIKIDEEYKL